MTHIYTYIDVMNTYTHTHTHTQASWAEEGVCVMSKQIEKVEKRIQKLLLRENQQQIHNLFAAAAVVVWALKLLIYAPLSC